MRDKALVLDANILVRAVLGKKVREIPERYAEGAMFFVPETALAEAEEHLPVLILRRSGDPEKALEVLRALLAGAGHGSCVGVSDLDRGRRLF